MLEQDLKPRRIDLISVFLFIYVTLDTLLFGTNSNTAMHYLMVIITLAHVFYLLNANYFAINQHSVLTIAVVLGNMVVISLFLSTVRGSDTFNIQYIMNLLILCQCVLYINIATLEQFVQAYQKVLSVLSIVGIVAFVLHILDLDRFFPSISIVNESGYSYSFWGITAIATAYNRLQGIFREPGVYSIFLSLALFFELFFSKKPNLYRLFSLAISIYLTYSTAGYIVVLLCFLLLLFSTQIKTRVKVGIFVGICVVYLLIEGSSVYYAVFGKLFTENATKNSRLYSIIAGLKMSMQHPIFGLGWDYVINNYTSFVDLLYGLDNVSFTNTFIRLATTYGWIFTGILLVGTYRFFRYKLRTMIAIGAFIIWIIALSNEAMLLNPIVYTIALMGYRCPTPLFTMED